MNYPPPQPQPPLQPAKKKGRGCLIALAIIGGVFVVIAVVGGVIAYRVAQSPEGKKAISIMGEGAKIATESLNAPGTKELRALGCAQAVVMDMERMNALGQAIDPDAAPPVSTLGYRLMVTCQGTKRGAGITCDQAAATYRAAVGTPIGAYLVTVGDATGNHATCATIYGVDGARITDVDLEHAKKK